MALGLAIGAHPHYHHKEPSGKMTPHLDLSSIEAVVFDFDGTLAETKIDFAKMRRLIIEHLKHWDIWEDGLEQDRYVLDIIKAGCEKLAQDADAVSRFQAGADAILEQVELETCASAHPFPGVVEALQQLHANGFKVGIVTRNCRAGVASVTSRYHLHHDLLSTRDDVTRVKPDPDHFRRAVEQLAADPRRTVMIGDHITDVQGVNGTGAIAIGVLTQKTTREEFDAVGANIVFDDVPAAVAAIIEARTCR